MAARGLALTSGGRGSLGGIGGAAAWRAPPAAVASAASILPPRGRAAATTSAAAGKQGGGDSADSAASAAAAAAAALDVYDAAYFNEDTPLISDDAYDSLKAQAKAAGKKSSSRVGAPPPASSALPKAAHPARLLSLDAVHSREEAEAWGARTAARLEAGGAHTATTSWAVEPKLDGLAARCTFTRGSLSAVVTRGDGRVGEDVTPAAAGGRIAGLPPVLDGCNADVEVRGEVFMTDADFAAANEAAAAAGLPPFSNPRNLAAATLRAAATVGRGDGPPSAAAAAASARRLSFAAYDLVVPGGGGGGGSTTATTNPPPPLPTHTAALAWLRSVGVSVPASASTHPTFDAALAAAQAWMAGRDGLGFAVDGAVIKADAPGARVALGSSPSAPRWAVAWKFPATEAVATLTAVTWQLGRSGALVPVAELSPTVVGGVTVSRASLHNPANVRALGLRVGDRVVVARAGDVVPQVVRALVEARTGGEAAVEEPGACPACGSALVGGGGGGGCGKEADTPPPSTTATATASIPAIDDAAASADALRCVNRACPGRALKRVQHFAACLTTGAAERRGGPGGESPDLAALGGLGPATVAAVVDAGLAADAADLVGLGAGALAGLPGFGPRRAAKVAAALAAAARAAPPGAVVAGLGIPGVGRGVADALVASTGGLAALADAAADEERLTAVPGVGRVTAAALARWWAADDNAALVSRLLAAGVGTGEVVVALPSSSPTPASGTTPNPCAGGTFVFTGRVAGLTRAGAAAAVAAAGGKAVASVSSSTTAVVAGDAPGAAKLAAAAAAGVPVIPAAAFFGPGGTVVWTGGGGS